MKKPRAKGKPGNTFLPGPPIPGHIMYHCDDHRLLLIDGQLVKFSRIEYLLVLMVLKKKEGYVSSPQLICAAYGSDPSDPRTIRLLWRRMSRIRLKLWDLGIIIVSVSGRGYSGYSYKSKPLDESVQEKIIDTEERQLTV